MGRLSARAFAVHDRSYRSGIRFAEAVISLFVAGMAIAGCTSSGDSSAAASAASAGIATTGSRTASVGSASTDSASEKNLTIDPRRSKGESPSDSSAASPSPPSMSAPTSDRAGSRHAPAAHPAGSALAAYRTWVKHASTGEFAAMWSSLAPAQQAAVAKRRFSLCQNEFVQEGGLTAITYKRTVSKKPGTIVIPGTSDRVQAVAIDAVLGLESHDPQTLSVTVAWYVDGSQWRWVLTNAQIAAYQRNSCPTF
ncbi:MAG: hypothetical protein J2P16_00500 [Mycobacterium sp.]|nr:hypothetical protein [Mycobacterium sp.]